MTGFAPSARWTWQAVEGKALSGEVVETRIASTDCGVIPAASHARCPATTAKSDDAWPCSTQYLVRIPVKATIWSGSRPSGAATYWLSTTREGTYEPVPTMRLRFTGFLFTRLWRPSGMTCQATSRGAARL